MPAPSTFFQEALRAWLTRLEDLIAAVGTGTVSGPGSTVVNRIALWANTGGTAIKNSLVSIDSSGSITLPSGQTVDGRDVSVDGAALAAHIANVSNPHAVTKAQVGLGNVTNDAQLTRGAGDWSGFSVKASPVGADRLLLEDSAAAGAKKYTLISDLPGSGGGAGAYLEVQQATVTTDITTTSTSYVDMAGASITLSVASGDDLLISFDVGAFNTTGSVFVQIQVDGGAAEYVVSTTANASGSTCGDWVATGLSVGSHTVKLQWKVNAGTALCSAATGENHHAVLIVERVHV